MLLETTLLDTYILGGVKYINGLVWFSGIASHNESLNVQIFKRSCTPRENLDDATLL